MSNPNTGTIQTQYPSNASKMCVGQPCGVKKTWITRHYCKDAYVFNNALPWINEDEKKIRGRASSRWNFILTIPTSNQIYLHSIPVRFIFSALGCVKHVDSPSRCPRHHHQHLTVTTAEPSCSICALYQRLIPQQLCIMQTIAYSVMTCTPSTHIIWKAPRCNSVINNECRVRVSRLTERRADCLGNATLMKVFPQLSVPLHTHIEDSQSHINDQVARQTLPACLCMHKRVISYVLCVCRLLENAASNLSDHLGDYVNEMLNMNVKMKM